MKYYLAPMMGYTDCYLRNLAEKLYGDNIQTFSEMIVDKAIIHNEINIIQKHFLKNNKSAIQIAGSDPQEITQAINSILFILAKYSVIPVKFISFLKIDLLIGNVIKSHLDELAKWFDI